MKLDGTQVEVGLIVYDAFLGGGQVVEIYNDSFAVRFGTVTRTFHDGGLIAGRKTLTLSRPFVIEPTATQLPIITKILTALEIKFTV